MADPYLGEVRLMSFGYPPTGWALCNGQLLAISQSQALFSLLGTTYGGDGRTTFALPNLQGCVPIHVGQGFTLGQVGGEQSHTLTIGEFPQHMHTVSASPAAATAAIPSSSLMLAQAGFPIYRAPSSLGPMQGTTIATTGSSQAHSNIQPILTISFCIALQGIYPSRT